MADHARLTMALCCVAYLHLHGDSALEVVLLLANKGLLIGGALQSPG